MKTLYHGTSSINLSCIHEIGLVPGHAKGGDVWAKEHHMSLATEAKKREPSVFVADDPEDAENFAKLAAEEMGGHPVVLKLNVPVKLFETFVPDELFDSDNIEHAWRAHSIPASCIAEALPVKEGPSDFALMGLLSEVMERLHAA